MTQETRKDPRAQILGLKVRYKSGTVDEFIEDHSHDISKGGLFVRSETPFPTGTLLKFEIFLANQESLFNGVARVVWVREPSQASDALPPGMGMKFIKMDEASRILLEKILRRAEEHLAASVPEFEKTPTQTTVSTGDLGPEARRRPHVSQRPTFLGVAPASVTPPPPSVKPQFAPRTSTFIGVAPSAPPVASIDSLTVASVVVPKPSMKPDLAGIAEDALSSPLFLKSPPVPNFETEGEKKKIGLELSAKDEPAIEEERITVDKVDTFERKTPFSEHPAPLYASSTDTENNAGSVSSTSHVQNTSKRKEEDSSSQTSSSSKILIALLLVLVFAGLAYAWYASQDATGNKETSAVAEPPTQVELQENKPRIEPSAISAPSASASVDSAFNSANVPSLATETVPKAPVGLPLQQAHSNSGVSVHAPSLLPSTENAKGRSSQVNPPSLLPKEPPPSPTPSSPVPINPPVIDKDKKQPSSLEKDPKSDLF